VIVTTLPATVIKGYNMEKEKISRRRTHEKKNQDGGGKKKGGNGEIQIAPSSPLYDKESAGSVR